MTILNGQKIFYDGATRYHKTTTLKVRSCRVVKISRFSSCLDSGIGIAKTNDCSDGWIATNLFAVDTGRRFVVRTMVLVSAGLLWSPGICTAISTENEVRVIEQLERAAVLAYSERDFESALKSINQLIDRDPKEPRWREMRATTLVDGKNFVDAISDFDECVELLGRGDSLDKARLLSGKGLALEGINLFEEAASTYLESIEMARRLGSPADPYVLNSLGNCRASMGEWKQARKDYLESAASFQNSRAKDGIAGRMQRRLDGSIYAFSNAALMLAQIGDDDGAIKEMQGIARRAPGSADIRIALCSMYWSKGLEAEAESEWNFACSNITSGCSKYQDIDWLVRVRRWPPVMVERLEAFLSLRSSKLAGNSGKQAFKE